ncbi:MAG: acyl carrier protein [Firmicutes bacterium]|nr:acyl carrier protein [Bacillota bacterium]
MDTLEILQKAIQKELGRDVGVLTMSTTFEDMALDSLDAVQVIMAIEEAFDIEVADEDVDGIRTVGQLVEYIESKTR